MLTFAWLGRLGPVTFNWQGQNYELLHPEYLAIVWVAPLLLLGLRFSLADLPWQQRWLSWLLRVALVGTLALTLARLVTHSDSQALGIVFLVDVSDSVPDEALVQARDTLGSYLAQLPVDAEAQLISFASRPRLHELSRDPAGGTWRVPEATALRHAADPATNAQTPPAQTEAGAATNIEAAMQLAYGVLPPGKLKRVVLFSDGIETQGNLLAEASRAKGFGVRLFAVPYTQAPPGEVAVHKLELPQKVELGQSFKVRASIYSTRPTRARARLYQGETLNGLGGVRELELTPGVTDVEFDSVVRVGGEVVYRIVVDELQDDRFAENNSYSAHLDVPGRPMVLYVEGQPQRASYLASALTAQQFDVDVRQPTAFPTSLAELERYDFVILSDVAANQVSAQSQAVVERYLRDLGGGFLFAGGVAGYSLGGWSNTTLARLLPVRMDAEQRKDIPSVAMALVIDRSGSMSGLPLEMAKAACRATVATLQGDDLVEIIAFDTEPKRYVKLQPARYSSRIQNEVMRIQSEGGTDFFPALDMAYQDISVAQARKKHVIFLTDGRADTPGIRDLVQAMLAESITVTTVGLGDGADGELLRMIAETGGGRYHHAADPNSLPRIFTRETEMISRQSAVQEWFPVIQTSNADFLRGIAINTAPLLHGYVATQMKGPPAQQILASDTGEPILARWRVGLGHSLAWTSDVKNNWAVDWLRWPGFSRFWGQLVREHMRQKSRREFDMKTSLIGDQVIATVDAYTADERFDNELRATLTLRRSGETTDPTQYPMPQVAPGRYEARFPLREYGTFSLQAEHFRETENGELERVGTSYGSLSHPYPTEYQSFEADAARLQAAATVTGGDLDPSPQALIDPADERVKSVSQLWPYVLLAALGLFLLDILLRRVRLFDRNFMRYT